VPRVNKYWFNQSLKPHAFDLELSRRLLAGEGFHYDSGTLRDKSGHAVEFSLITNAGNSARAGMASMIQQDLAAIGIRLNIVTLDFPSLLERIGKTFAYESCLLGFNNADLDPDSQMNLWLSSGANHPWNPKQSSPATDWEAEIDRLMREQASTGDGARRKALFDRVQEIASREAPLLYLLNRNALVAAQPDVSGLKPSPLAPRLVWNIEELRVRTAR
jgi:peptide/nickel transport system substrate-binding protein